LPFTVSEKRGFLFFIDIQWKGAFLLIGIRFFSIFPHSHGNLTFLPVYPMMVPGVIFSGWFLVRISLPSFPSSTLIEGPSLKVNFSLAISRFWDGAQLALQPSRSKQGNPRPFLGPSRSFFCLKGSFREQIWSRAA